MVKVRIGTSGYSYFWNKGKPTPFQWYLQQGFKTVEINASFYRFPSIKWVKTWINCSDDFDFSIKVHRSITHYAKLRGKAISLWERFRQPLKEIENKVTFWLFQMPYNFVYNEKNLKEMLSFSKKLI